MNNTTKLIAKHLREVFLGGNWTVSNMKDHLSDVTWNESIYKVDGFNTVATLTFHIGYYLKAAIAVINNDTFSFKDEFSFMHPPINNETDWQNLKDSVFNDVELLSSLIENLPDETLYKTFVEEKYGNYYRNLHGIIEHTHYHLGQIVLIKKLVRAKA